jgi:peptide/nickel transport system permease protein
MADAQEQIPEGNDPEAGPAVIVPHPRLREFAFSLRRLYRNPLTIIGTVIIVIFGLIAVFAPFIAPPANPAKPYNMPHDGWRIDPSPPSAKNPDRKSVV